MSTKSTLAHGQSFHLYHDLMIGDDFVYLDISNCGTCKKHETIKIPIDIWETIRQAAGIRFDLFNKSDKELRLIVEKEIDDRIAEYKTAKNKHDRALLSFYGSAYGGIDKPRTTQVKLRLKYLKKERDFQLCIKKKMAAHKIVKRNG